ncbi:hypothetical protein ABMA28_010010 [Loxostege sticticalis]|uniref:Uncharacterized protein n=1 Tax=Loxostege sticticalis TaxID=481309 RepID=A0ABD0S9F0_LOXSC
MAKKRLLMKLILTAILYLTQTEAMILRNNALINKMVSHFQKDNNLSLEPKQKQEKDSNEEQRAQNPEKVMSLMQNVLCRNFPAIPCRIITEDETLKKLIGKSIQQIKYKTLSIDKTTAAPGYHLTLFPTINSEELSNYLQVRSPSKSYKGFYDKRNINEDVVYQNQKPHSMNYYAQSQEKQQKTSKKSKKESKNKRTTVFSGRKKIRKFYPHKVKYKDKNKNSNVRKDFGDYSEEKLSMSVEIPDMTLTKRHQHITYKAEPADPPVWRIDYTKHGEPSINNMLGYEDDRLKGKLMKAGPPIIVDENVQERDSRKDILHPDVYIKKNYLRKNPVGLNSEGME